jgi:hypothetical protein
MTRPLERINLLLTRGYCFSTCCFSIFFYLVKGSAFIDHATRHPFAAFRSLCASDVGEHI